MTDCRVFFTSVWKKKINQDAHEKTRHFQSCSSRPLNNFEKQPLQVLRYNPLLKAGSVRMRSKNSSHLHSKKCQVRVWQRTSLVFNLVQQLNQDMEIFFLPLLPVFPYKIFCSVLLCLKFLMHQIRCLSAFQELNMMKGYANSSVGGFLS